MPYTKGKYEAMQKNVKIFVRGVEKFGDVWMGTPQSKHPKHFLNPGLSQLESILNGEGSKITMGASPKFAQSLGLVGPEILSTVFWMNKIDHRIFELCECKENPLKNFQGRHHSPHRLQSLDIVRPKSFPTAFEWSKSVKAFSSYFRAKKRSVGRVQTNSRSHRPFH